MHERAAREVLDDGMRAGTTCPILVSRNSSTGWSRSAKRVG